MPTYDYRCLRCGYIQEFTHGMKASPKVRCPNCRKLGMRKMVGGNIIFKGPGFTRALGASGKPVYDPELLK